MSVVGTAVFNRLRAFQEGLLGLSISISEACCEFTVHATADRMHPGVNYHSFCFCVAWHKDWTVKSPGDGLPTYYPSPDANDPFVVMMVAWEDGVFNKLVAHVLTPEVNTSHGPVSVLDTRVNSSAFSR